MIRTQKWVLMAKQGLRKICILKDQFGLKLGGGTKREGEGEEKRKRKKKKRRRGRRRAKPKVWMLGFWYGNYLEYGFCIDHMNFKA